MSKTGIGIYVTVLQEMSNNTFPVAFAVSVNVLETRCSYCMASPRDPARVLMSSSPVLPAFMSLAVFSQAVY